MIPSSLIGGASNQQIRIGIAGAGGIGSNLAVVLARSGFVRFEIVDFDVVEAGNLHRQYYFLEDIGRSKVEALAKHLRAINPDVEVQTHQVQLTSENITDYFQSADCLCEAFDQASAKQMFLEAFMASPKLKVMASGMAGIENKTLVAIRKIKDNLYIIGDGVTPVDSANPAYAPRVTACAALMASVVLEYFATSTQMSG